MVDYEKVLALAKECWDEVDYCTEKENAYIFSKYDCTDIGGSSPVVVFKDTGKRWCLVAYLGGGLNTPTIREGAI